MCRSRKARQPRALHYSAGVVTDDWFSAPTVAAECGIHCGSSDPTTIPPINGVRCPEVTSSYRIG